MNNQDNLLFIAVLIEQAYNRNYMRLERKNLRDIMNPFEVPSNHFKQMFRLDKQSVQNLIASLENHIRNTSIPIHLKVLCTLNFLASGSYQSTVGNSHWTSLSQPSMSRVIAEVCSAVADNFLQQWVKFPTTLNEKLAVKHEFFEKWGARGVIGVIDGTHVDILAPSINDNVHPPHVYINRKGKHSINTMLICDSNLKILSCNARFPGSVHDAAIWQQSTVRAYLAQEYENGDKATHLIGDSGYPLEPWLFTPIANAEEGTPQEHFNRELTSVRNVVERTNGVLKGRFRCLSKQRMLMYSPHKAANIIYTACILHNMAIAANIPLLENDIEYRDNFEVNVGDGINVQNNLFLEARDVRNNYIRQNFMYN